MPWAGITRTLIIVVFVAAVLLLAVWLGQRSLIYLPDRSSPPVPDGAAEVELRTGDGLELAAWEFGPADADRDAAVLVAPGNAGNRAGRAGLARDLAAEGFTVLLLEYRGYGGNPGSPTEQGLYDDARAAWDHLRDRFEVERIVLFGESLGAGVVTELAAGTEPAGLVLRSPFTGLADVGRVHYRFLPVGLLLRDRYPVLDRFEAIDAPVTVIYGEADEVVPAEQSREVARAAEAAGLAVSTVEVDAAGHNDRALADGPEVVDAVAALADRAGLTAGSR